METSAKLEGNPAAFSYGWVLFFLNVLLVAYISALEVFPSSFSNQLAQLYEVEVSTVTYNLSFYYYALIIFQIPLAVLIDKHRTSFFVITSLLITTLSLLLFSQHYTLVAMAIARFLMGIGAACVLLHSIKCLADWFPAKKFAIRLGLFICLEAFLTLIFSNLIDKATQLLGWREAVLYLAAIGLIFTGFTFLIMRRFKEKYDVYFPEKPPEFKPLLRKLFDSSQMWIIGLSLGFSIGIVYSFLGRWATPIFTLGYNLSVSDAAVLILVANVGYSFGALFFTYLSSLLKQRKILIPGCLAAALIMLILIIYPPYLANYFISIASFLLGFFVSAANLGYVIIHEQNASQITATAIASVNIFYAVTMAAFDTLITVFLRLQTTLKGTSEYVLQDFETALFRLPIYFGLALFFSFFIRKTYAKQVDF